MLEQIIKFLNIQIVGLNYFQQIFELGELVRTEDKSFPAAYTAAGNFTHITNLDSFNGLCYWRKVGDVQQNQILDDRYNPQDPVMEITYELKLVGAIPKSLIGDDAFSDDALAVSISKALESNSGALRKTINARKVRVTANRYTTNKVDIVNEEFDNTNTEIRHEWAYVSVNVEVVVEIVNSCLLALCDAMPVQIQIWAGIQDDGTTDFFILDTNG